jgi:hypothetical protein
MAAAIKTQHFNSYLKGREERPTEPYYAEPGSGKVSTQRIKWEDQPDQQKRPQEVTLKAEPRISQGRPRDPRCVAEEWLNQWKVWAGNTLRLRNDKVNHTVRGDGTSQKPQADGMSLTQCSSSTRDTDVSHEGTSIEMDQGTGTSYDPGSGKKLSNSQNRKESRCGIQKSYSLPHENEDITLDDYNGEVMSPKAEGFRQRLKDKKFRKRAEVNTARYMDRTAQILSLERSSKYPFSTICAESEVVRCDSNKRTTSGIDTRGKRIHNNNNDQQYMGIHLKSDVDEMKAFEPYTKYSTGDNLIYSKRIRKRNKRFHRNQQRQELLNKCLNYDEIFNEPLDGISSDKYNIHPSLKQTTKHSEGKMETHSGDRTIDLWCRELAGAWVAEAKRMNNEEELTVGPTPNTSDFINKTQQRDLKYKARIIDTTMMVNGIEQRIIDNTVIETAQSPVENTYQWDLKDKSLDEILDQLDKIKEDPNIPMPNIKSDMATLEEFLEYTKELPDATNYQTHLDNEDSEKSKDENSLLYLQSSCTDCLHEHRPIGFPTELWPHVLDTQKPLVNQRWIGYDPNKVGEKIDNLRKHLRISEERPYAHPYFLAQAIANLDRFEVKESDGITPLIHSKFTHRLELLPGTRPIREKPQNFSENQKAFLKAKLNILERQGKVKQRNGLQDNDWLHRLVLVEHPSRMEAFRTKHGTNVQQAINDPANEYEVSQLFRLTIDCRELNKKTVVEPFPMPDNNMGKENIIGSRYMSVSDAADAFYAVGLREEDYGKTGFTALGKQWVMTVMLQGGVNSPGHFARIINETFEGVPLSKICPFQDDALCHATDLKLALENQQLMYDRIRSNSIMLKAEKTKLAYSTCKFLGNIYTPIGRLPDPSKIEAILNINHRPCTPKDVRHIVGLIIWNIEFLPNGMALLSHLTDLVRKDADVIAMWKDEVHGKVLERLKAGLVSAPCLKPIDVSRPFRIHVDACKNGRGIGAVLLQEYDNKWRPCSYYSKALKPAQRQWSATELEAHGLVSAARHWDRYLQNGHLWTAVVDHKALIYLVVKRTKTANTRLLNSVMKLQGHHFEIIHRDGQQHFDADAVSRMLHSGDINEARESESESDDEHLVTMKDIKNLQRFFTLQLEQQTGSPIDRKRDAAVVSPSPPTLPIATSNSAETSVDDETHIAAQTLLELKQTNHLQL